MHLSCENYALSKSKLNHQTYHYYLCIYIIMFFQLFHRLIAIASTMINHDKHVHMNLLKLFLLSPSGLDRRIKVLPSKSHAVEEGTLPLSNLHFNITLQKKSVTFFTLGGGVKIGLRYTFFLQKYCSLKAFFWFFVTLSGK